MCSALAAASLPLAAWADAHPAATAAHGRGAALKKRADGEMESLRYGEALDDYTEAYSLTHDPALLYNRARVLEALERFGEAIEELDHFVRDAPPELKARVPKLAELRTDLRAHIALLTVRCTVAGARVLVRKQVVATTPVRGPIPLNAGPAVLEVLADGYDAFQQPIDLPRAGDLAVDVKLVARANKTVGHLVVSASPDGSNVFVDGSAFGASPAEGPVAAGTHEIVVTHPGFRDARTSAVVAEDQRRELQLTLERKRTITSAWWFWTGIAVVGATAAAVTIGVLAQKSAGHGDFTPGQVTGP